MRALRFAGALAGTALAAALFAACGGAPEPLRAAVGSSNPAIAPEADGGAPREAPRLEEAPGSLPLVPQPAATAGPSGGGPIEPPQPTAAATAQPHAQEPGAAPPRTACEALRAVKAAEPLFAHPPLPCERADRLLYYRRDAGGSCGPSSALTVEAGGGVTLETTAAGDAPNAAGACPVSRVARTELQPDDARKLIASSCAAFNGGYSLERGIGCQSAAVRLFFFDGESVLGETAALPCPPHALDRVVADLEAAAAPLK